MQSHSNDSQRNGHQPLASSSATTFLVVQLVLIVGAFAYGSQRYWSLQEAKLPPVAQNEPIQIEAQYDRPAVVSDEQLTQVLLKLRPKLRGPQPKINHVDHALRFWGIDATFADSECLSGQEMRALLTDHRAFASAWGPKAKPFLLPNLREGNRELAFRTRAGDATSSHVDHTLACLAEVGTPLDYPVQTPRGELPLRAAFTQALNSFSLNQAEYEWSALVFLHYLSSVPSWHTTEGQLVTWDRLADRLMRQRLAQGTCYGNHRLYALAAMLQLDRRVNSQSAESQPSRLLTEAARTSVVEYLREVTQRLSETQHADGYWDGRWPGQEWDGPQPEKVEGPFGILADRLLATGHTLEWWAIAPSEVLPEDQVVSRAGQWLANTINDMSDSEVAKLYPFLTHAGRSLAMWRNRSPHEALPAEHTQPRPEPPPQPEPKQVPGPSDETKS